jgi:hypothetical protein
MTDAGARGHSAAEQRLIDSVGRGDLLDLAGDGPVDEAAMRSWGDDRSVSATVIRELVRGRLVSEPDPHGIRLRGARITGQLDLENVAGELALDLRDCLLSDGVVLRCAELPTLTLTGCRIGQAPGSPDAPVDATRLTARLLSLAGSTVTADGTAAVRVAAARVGTLDCRGATFENSSGPALDADGLRVDQSVFLNDGFTAAGIGDRGTVRLLGAHIGGQLNCGGARLRGTTGPALDAGNLSVARDVLLHGGFTATSAGGQGTIRLAAARVGTLLCAGARLENTGGPALDANNLTVDWDLGLNDGFTATGADEDGTVLLTSARIGSLFDCTGAKLANTTGPALDANGLQVGQDVALDHGFAARTGHPVALILTDARIGGVLRFDAEARDQWSLVEVDGLTYNGLPQPASLRPWLRLLREHTPRYAAQPYQHLAAAYRAAGHDREARTVLIAQRRDQLDRAGPTRSERAWGRLTGLTLGYGYQPWRALLLLVATLVAATALSVTAGHHDALARKPPAGTGTPAGPCTTIDQIGVGLDLGTPLIKTGARDRCQPTPTPMGQTLLVAGWLLQLLAWAFATLFVAGFTSAVRKF